jgi:DNA-binding LytR/AlgR family response regulator
MKTKIIPLLTDVHVGSRMHLPPENIIMIRAEINYSIIYLTDGKQFIVSTCLGKLENRLALVPSFARVHRSYLVNLDYCKSYEPGHFLLENDLQCFVSRRKIKRLIEEKRVVI